MNGARDVPARSAPHKTKAPFDSRGGSAFGHAASRDVSRSVH
jgi:hypothetical protein